MKLRNVLIAVAGLAVAGGAATAASAATPWQAHHPARVEVNHRLDNLNRHIRFDRRHGDINAAQAYRLHQRAHMIRMQERYFARHNHGHLARGEARMLNHEEAGLHDRVG